MPKIAALGGLSSRGFGEFAQQTAANYIEDVFSTYLYTGNGTYSPKTGVNTINNGIDLLGKGGLVWAKIRGDVSGSHALFDTARGVSQVLSSNLTDAQTLYSGYGVTSFNSNGFTLEGNLYGENQNGKSDVAWTFRKQPKFFDIVTYTGNGSFSQTVSHNLGSVPGAIIIKRIDTSSNWFGYFRADNTQGWQGLSLNLTTVSSAGFVLTPDACTATTFQPVQVQDAVGNPANTNGASYIAYIFAHNAGGFGADGSQNVISCGSYTGNGSATGPVVNLGYEPQWLLVKRASSGYSGNWFIIDNMRGMISGGSDAYLIPNASDPEYPPSTGVDFISPNATGFQVTGTGPFINESGASYIYMAIRRGPMRTPTSGTSVFSPVIWTGNDASNRVVGTLNSVDLMFNRTRTTTTQSWWVTPRLTNGIMSSDLTLAEGSATPYLGFAVQSGVNLVSPTAGNVNASPYTSIGDMFCRAPGFFDVVCWSGTSADQTLNHNLTVPPELIIYKTRGTTSNWYTAYSFTNTTYGYSLLNLTSAPGAQAYSSGGPFSAQPTSTQFSVGQFYNTSTMVAYLFASCPGVSKVGTYTGTGGTQTISCGFTGGARFVMIKRTDSTGDWWVWDTARGMVAGTDPRLAYNSTAAETNANWVYTTTGGFQIVTSDATVNASGGTYIYLAIA